MASRLGTWRTKLFAYSRCRMLAADLRRFKAIRRMTASLQDRTVRLARTNGGPASITATRPSNRQALGHEQLRFRPRHEPRKHFVTPVDPTPELPLIGDPVPLLDPPPQRGCLQTTRMEIEGEVDDSCQARLGLGGRDRARP